MPKQNNSETNYYDESETENSPKNRRTLVAAVLAIALLVIGGALIFGAMAGNKTAEPNEAKNSEPVAEDKTEETTKTVETAAANPGTDNQNVSELKSSLEPPAGWSVQENNDGTRTVVIFFKPKPEIDSAGNEIFTENINISRNRLSDAKVKNLAEYVNSVEDRVEKQMTNVVPTKNFEILLDDGTPAIVTAFAYTLNNVSLRSLMMFTGRGDDVYTVIGIVTDSNWDEEKDSLWTSLMSFKIPAAK